MTVLKRVGTSIAAAALALTLVACQGVGGSDSTASTPAASSTPVTTSTAGPGVSVLSPKLMIPGLNRERTVRLYLPPGYATSTKRYPVLYMHDGQNLFDAATAYAGEWGVDETLNELAKTKGLELIVVGIDNGGDKRMTELNPWDFERFGKGEGAQYMDFIVKVLKPQIDATYRTLPGREATGIMGSSMGGLISQYAILQYPQVFSKAGIFSPAYWPGMAVFDMTAMQRPAPDARLAFTMGGKEGGAVPLYDRMLAQLQAQGHPAANTWAKLTPQAEHNEAAWRADFGAAVQWLFAPTQP